MVGIEFWENYFVYKNGARELDYWLINVLFRILM